MSTGSAAEEQQAGEQQPEALQRGFRADVELVLVDCVVFDEAGQLVVDLESADIAVYEDGERMRIEFFEREGYLDEMPREHVRRPSRPALWRPFPRNILLVYDGLNTAPGQVNRMRSAMHRFVEGLAETDRVQLIMLTPGRRLLIPVPFPGPRDQLRNWIDELPGNPIIESEIAAHEQEILEQLYGTSMSAVTTANAETFDIREQLAKIKQAITLARSFAQSEATRASYTMDALVSMGNYLVRSELPRGPIFVVLVSGGVSLRPGISYFAIINKRVDQVNEVVFSGGGTGTGDVAFREEATFDLTGDMQLLVEQLARLNATLYTLDAQGVPIRPGETPSSFRESNLPPGERLLAQKDRQQSLRLLAEESGGIAFINSNNFDRAFDRILSDASFRYVLGYRPPVERPVGTYVPIRVEVRRPGMTVRARTGYVVTESASQ